MSRFHQSWLLGAAGAAAFGFAAVTAGPAHALFVPDELAGDVGNQSCSGGNGNNPNCTAGPGAVLDFETPQIAKYEFNESTGEFVLENVGTAYVGIIDGSEFTFSGFDAGDPKTGTWTYTPDIGEDPFVTAYGLGYAGQTDLFAWAGLGTGGFSDSWTLPNALSNITFYDTGVVPLPAAAWLMLGGLGLMGGAMRKLRRPEAEAA